MKGVCLLQRKGIKMKRKQPCPLRVLSGSVVSEGISSDPGLGVVPRLRTNLPDQEALMRLDTDPLLMPSLRSVNLTPVPLLLASFCMGSGWMSPNHRF